MGSYLKIFMGVLVVCKNKIIEVDEYTYSECLLCYRKYFSEEYKYCPNDAAKVKYIYKKVEKAEISWVDITDKIDENFFHIPSTDLNFDIYNSNMTEFVFGENYDKMEGLLGIANKEEQEKMIKEFKEHFTKELEYLKTQYLEVRIIYDLVTYWY